MRAALRRPGGAVHPPIDCANLSYDPGPREFFVNGVPIVFKRRELLILETLMKREKLGSTGIGQGIAIPHGKLPSISRVYGLFARLAQPVDFDSVDGQPVDLVFVLLAPEDAGADHLKALAKISRLLRDPAVVAKLRGTDDAQGLYAILTEPAANPVANPKSASAA